jgi:hypothetical protein
MRELHIDSSIILKWISKEIGENMKGVEVDGPRVQCSDLQNTGIYFTVP